MQPMSFHFKETDRLMQQAVAGRIFPGAVLLVAVEGHVVLHSPYGMADIFSRRPVTRATVFDLASLTKPLVTTLVSMYLFQHGQLDLDRPCIEYWPRLKGVGKGKITARHLLSHSSGLPAWRPYYLCLRSRPGAQRMETLKQWIMAEPLCAEPGEKADYSDIGFMVLQWVLEHIAGRPLTQLYDDIIRRPLGLDDLFFIDLQQEKPRRPYAATELCPWRNRMLSGEVHDDNTWVIGGVAGHAGLFGTAGEVYALLQGLLSSEQGQGRHPVFDRSILRHFFTRHNQSNWALGFDTPSEKNSSAGHYFNPESVGHLGYTGTSFWMDRERAVIVLLLTNRVHPCRYDARIRAFRPRLHDSVMAAIR